MSTTDRLATPRAAPARFDKNFIRQVVCEFRFPTLFSLESSRPPAAFAHTLRKAFPNYEMASDVSVTVGRVAESSCTHIFRSKKGELAVTLKAASIAVECTKYVSYEEFREILALVIKAAEAVIDSPFFTRIGLRYIDFLPVNDDALNGWIRAELIAPLDTGVFPGALEFVQRIVGPAEVGFYHFQHGFGASTAAKTGEYVLDYDFFAEDVVVPDSLSLLDKLHEQMYSLFRWSLADKAIEMLGPSKLQVSGD